MSEPSPSPPVPRPQSAPAPLRDEAAVGRFTAMADRAQRLRWRVVARSRRPVPVVAVAAPVLLLLSPIILLALAIGVFLPGRLRVNPALMMLSFGALLDSWASGPDERRR